MLQAAGKSRDVLKRLERVLKDGHGDLSRTDRVESEAIADLLRDVNSATQALSSALEVLEYLDGGNDLSLNAISYGSTHTNTPRSPSILTSSSDDGTKMSPASSAWSSDSRHASFLQRLSANGQSTAPYKPEKETQGHLDCINSDLQIGHMEERHANPPIGANRWSAQGTYFDPMSFDIESASSLIMGRRLGPEEPPPCTPENRPALQEALPSVDEGIEPPQRSTELPSVPVTSDSHGRIGRSLSLLARAPPNQRRTSVLSYSNSLRFSMRSPTFARREGKPSSSGTEHHLSPATDKDCTAAELHDTEHRRDVATSYHPAEFGTREAGHVESPRSLVLENSAQHLASAVTSSVRVARSRYRVVNPEKCYPHRADISVKISPASPQAARCRQSVDIGPPSSFIASGPIINVPNTRLQHEPPAEIDLEEETTNSIVASWNAGHWDDAKHNIEILLSRQTEHHSSSLARRCRHLLGVIHSLKGELDQALAEFILVFSTPIKEAFQFDAGHCAAAYWMADIYALLGRRTEALLAYSIAARNSILQDARWLPMRQQFLMEKEACRDGDMKTGVNLDWNDEAQESNAEAADSILHHGIIAKDVARTIMQAEIQPSNRTDRKLDSNRSRAMAFHDLGLQSGSWQDKHMLHLDATAFKSSGAWPLLYDPLFALESVREHRLLAPETDLLQCGLSATKIPKKGRLGFSCQDLRWLICALRKCLTKLKMEWSEVMLGSSPKFLARYTTTEAGIARVHFLSLPIYRLSFRPGYGVDICPDGVSSARIQNVDAKCDKGVSQEKVKRVKKTIRDFLETAAKRQEAMESRTMALPVMSINGVTSLHRK